jgi:hypothetical protein
MVDINQRKRMRLPEAETEEQNFNHDWDRSKRFMGRDHM